VHFLNEAFSAQPANGSVPESLLEKLALAYASSIKEFA
jgi:hypothetical protein